MTDPLAPVDAIRVSAGSPPRRLQPVTRDAGEERGGRHSDDRRDEPEERREDDGKHVDILA